jgi:NADP-dependent 3-hydroxy acid dehydrogenase YdfG
MQTVRRQVFEQGLRVGSIPPGLVVTALLASRHQRFRRLYPAPDFRAFDPIPCP